MRILALAILAIGATAAAAPAQAQTYDPNYPVCLHVYGRISYYECSLYLAAPVQHVGVGPFGAMRDQSVLRTRIPATIGAALQALPPQRLQTRRYSISTTWPSTSDTRRSIRPASSMLWVAISIATCVAFTSCISALKT